MNGAVFFLLTNLQLYTHAHRTHHFSVQVNSRTYVHIMHTYIQTSKSYSEDIYIAYTMENFALFKLSPLKVL